MQTNEVRELRRALLEIEWTSRRAPAKATLTRINDIAREALGAALAAESRPNSVPRLVPDELSAIAS